ncbi:MAG: SPASM domain-containing protein [Planctomycetes bacterium]|nr:SPASM domain-containing protein [Planctomycetota bacterium]
MTQPLREAALVSLPAPGETRDCLDPWYLVQIASDGRVKPCCVHSAVGALSQGQTLADILNGPPVRKLRSRLLTGKLDAECQSCNNKPVISLWDFRRHYIRDVVLHGARWDGHGGLDKRCCEGKRPSLRPIGLDDADWSIAERVTFRARKAVAGIAFCQLLVDSVSQIELEVSAAFTRPSQLAIAIDLVRSADSLVVRSESFRTDRPVTATCELETRGLHGACDLRILADLSGPDCGDVRVSVDHPWCLRED